MSTQPVSLALTGFMGSGKSTIGEMVARQIGWSFLDVDVQIETIHSCSASDLFRELGETSFRMIEAQVTAESLAAHHSVIALGGAAVDLPENQRQLTHEYKGCLIFLDGDFSELIERCLRQMQDEKATYRPLLHHPEKALAKFESRRAWNLANAHLRIDVGHKSCAETAKEIIEHVALRSS